MTVAITAEVDRVLLPAIIEEGIDSITREKAENFSESLQISTEIDISVLMRESLHEAIGSHTCRRTTKRTAAVR